MPSRIALLYITPTLWYGRTVHMYARALGPCMPSVTMGIKGLMPIVTFCKIRARANAWPCMEIDAALVFSILVGEL